MAELLKEPEVAAALIGGVCLIASTLVAVFKGGDLLRELRRRKIYRLRGKLKNTCPHAEFTPVKTDEGEDIVTSLLFVSPVGKINYHCQLCRASGSEYDVKSIEAYLKRLPPEKYIGETKKLKKAQKLRKKLDTLGNWLSE